MAAGSLNPPHPPPQLAPPRGSRGRVEKCNLMPTSIWFLHASIKGQSSAEDNEIENDILDATFTAEGISQTPTKPRKHPGAEMNKAARRILPHPATLFSFAAQRLQALKRIGSLPSD